MVRVSRACSSRWPMMPRRCAATALHRYAPMFVVEVCTLGVPSASRLSAGRPEPGSVIAASDAHVCTAYWRSWASPAPVLARAPPAPIATSSAASAATAPTLDRMAAPFPGRRPGEAAGGQADDRLWGGAAAPRPAQADRSASVGDRRAARVAGYRPAAAPMTIAAAKPP